MSDFFSNGYFGSKRIGFDGNVCFRGRSGQVDTILYRPTFLIGEATSKALTTRLLIDGKPICDANGVAAGVVKAYFDVDEECWHVRLWHVSEERLEAALQTAKTVEVVLCESSEKSEPIVLKGEPVKFNLKMKMGAVGKGWDVSFKGVPLVDPVVIDASRSPCLNADGQQYAESIIQTVQATLGPRGSDEEVTKAVEFIMGDNARVDVMIDSATVVERLDSMVSEVFGQLTKSMGEAIDKAMMGVAVGEPAKENLSADEPHKINFREFL